MYRFKILQASSLINEEQLNEQGKDGWQLITIVQRGQEFFFYFSRFESF